MRKRRIILLLIAVGVLVGVLVALIIPSREPSYQGIRLSQWVEKTFWDPALPQVAFGNVTGPPIGQPKRDVKEAAEAIKQMGTNAIPYLLTWIEYEPPAWKTTSLKAINKLFQRPFVDRRAFRGDRAAMALMILGERAEPAIPRLAALIGDAQRPNTALRAESVLVLLGTTVLSADIALMTNSSAWRIPAILYAARMGTSGRPASPALLGLLQHSDAEVREVASNALEKIDPEALERAMR